MIDRTVFLCIIALVALALLLDAPPERELVAAHVAVRGR